MCYHRGMRYFTHSESQDARRCWRKWYLNYYRTLKPRSERINESTFLGNIVHAALAEKYDRNQDPLATIVYLAGMAKQEQEDLLVGAGEGAIAIIESNIATVEKMEKFATIIIEGYLQWLEEEGMDQHLTFISAEAEVTVPMPVDNLPVPVTLLSKMDTRFIDKRSGARIFMDHKTVQTFSDRTKTAHLDTQFYFYSLVDYLIATTEGREDWTDGGVLNMLRKVKRTASANPPFFARHEVRHSLIELQNYFIRLTGEITTVLQKVEMLDAGVDHHLACPPNPTRDCSWDCSFMTLCAFMDDGSDSEGYIEASFEVVNPLRRYESVSGLEVVPNEAGS